MRTDRPKGKEGVSWVFARDEPLNGPANTLPYMIRSRKYRYAKSAKRRHNKDIGVIGELLGMYYSCYTIQNGNKGQQGGQIKESQPILGRHYDTYK